MIVKESLAENVYIVEDPFGKQKTTHSFRLQKYDGTATDIDQRIKANYLHMNGRFVVDEIYDIRSSGKGYQMKVKWKGFPDGMDSWEEVDTSWEDVPASVIDFLEKTRNTNLMY